VPAAIVANFAGRGASVMASLVLVAVCLRLAGVGVYGMLDYALRVLNLGLGEAVTRELAGLSSPAG